MSKSQVLLTTSDIRYDRRLLRIIKTLSEQDVRIKIYSRKRFADPVSNQFSMDIHWVEPIFSSSILFYAEYNFRLLFKLIFTKYQYVYCSDLDTLLVGKILKLFKNFKLIFDAHEIMEASPEIIDKPTHQNAWKWICKIGLPATDLRVTVSQSLVHYFKRQYQSDFILIRNLPEFRTIVLAERKQKIWYQGMLNKGRGLESMIIAMTQLKDYSLYLAGTGDIVKELKQLALEKRVEDRVVFLGMLTEEELIIRSADAYIAINLLDKESENYYFSLANKTFDYIQAELPAIHMNFPEYKSLLELYKVGELCDDLTPDSIIRAVHKIEQNYSNYCDQCKLAKKELNWEAESAHLKRCFINL
ncbi:MAG TPA: glycosyltransferase [Saprospiraceae bacterium]|nr:glycosyltransferase [Saprospiraceae bacterium]